MRPTIDTTTTLYRPFYVKTNAVGLGLLIVNVAVESDMDEHWSFNLPIYYSAWNYFTHTVKFRTFSFFPEFRYYPKAKSHQGFISAHLGLAWYNFAIGGETRIQDHNGGSPAYGGGIGGGWRKPVSKDGKWYIELYGSIGAYGTNYDRFHNQRNGLRTVSHHHGFYFGPDMLGVSIAYRFNLKRR